MRKTILALSITLLLISCDDHNKAKEFLKNRKNISDLEMKDFQFVDNEISDREYFNKISKYYFDMSEKDSEISEEVANNDIKEAKKYLDSAKNSKGGKLYTMVTYFKLINQDTSKLGYLYYNENNKFIKARCIK